MLQVVINGAADHVIDLVSFSLLLGGREEKKRIHAGIFLGGYFEKSKTLQKWMNTDALWLLLWRSSEADISCVVAFRGCRRDVSDGAVGNA